MPTRTADLDRLGGAGVAERASKMAALQAGVGNAAVLRMLAASPHVRGAGGGLSPPGRAAARSGHPRREPAAAPAGADPGTAGSEGATGAITHSEPFEIAMDVGAAASPAKEPAVPAALADSPEGSAMITPQDVPEPTPPALVAAPGGPSAAQGHGGHGGRRRGRGGGPQSEQEETMALPDIVEPELNFNDAVDAVMPYAAEIHGGARPTGFGVTSVTASVTGLTIKRRKNAYVVRGTLRQRIAWGLQSLGHIDISGADDADITRRNYRAVASDLTPDMSDLGGRPPRVRFWARDLTRRHELFHAHEFKSKGRGAAKATVRWLSTRRADSVGGVNALVARVPNRFLRLLAAAMGPRAENRAYGDGAPAYRHRANAIRKRGAAGGYR